MQRRIKLMWDYQCWPLWEPGSEHYALKPDSLPLSQATKDRLARWAAIPDAKLSKHMENPPDIIWTAEESRAFEVEGRALWTILQRELGAGFHVVYHSTVERRVLLPEDETVT
jgi:hypothetical protein